MLQVKWNLPTMDPWQSEVMEHQGNLILMCGRQVGKSEIMSKKIAEYLLNNPKNKLLIVSGVERQASGLYNKVLRAIEQSHNKELKKGRDKPLRTHLKLKNGSELITEPVGLDGSGARQHTLHGVIFEEMQLIPEDAFGAITPMLFTTGGFIWMLGTAWDTEGYVYERLSDPDFKVIRVNSEEVAEMRPEPARSILKRHLEKEKIRLSEAMYMQEYLAIPSDKTRQIYNDALIKSCMTLERENMINKRRRHVAGIDPAGLGEDEGAITILDTEDKENIKQIEFIITKKLYTTQMTDKILFLNNQYNLEKIYVDDGGVGFGVFSELLNHGDTRNKTISLNNATRSLTMDDEKRKKILKEDLYINLLKFMERGQIKLLKDNEIRESLKSVKFEYNEKTKKLIISSNYNHPVESLTRAAWDAEGKNLNPIVRTIKV